MYRAEETAEGAVVVHDAAKLRLLRHNFDICGGAVNAVIIGRHDRRSKCGVTAAPDGDGTINLIFSHVDGRDECRAWSTGTDRSALRRWSVNHSSATGRSRRVVFTSKHGGDREL